MTGRLKLRVIACPSLRPELEALAEQSHSGVSFHYLAMALHQSSASMLRQQLQHAIDATTGCDAIAIGYGLCNRGVVGLVARTIPLVLPRAHDCIGLLLGSSKRYLETLEDEPGTYFESAGWLSAGHDEDPSQFTFGPNSNVRLEQLVARYGDEAAAYLMQELAGLTKHYKRLAYIATDTATSASLETEARVIAKQRGLRYQHLHGDTGWLNRLLSGKWTDKEFLIVRPGCSVGLVSDERLIAEV